MICSELLGPRSNLPVCKIGHDFTSWITNTLKKNLRWAILFFFLFFFTVSHSLISCLAKMLHCHWILPFSFCRREDKSVFVKRDYGDRENPGEWKRKEDEEGRVVSGGRLGLMFYWRESDMTYEWVALEEQSFFPN